MLGYEWSQPVALGALLLLPLYAWQRRRLAARDRVPYATLRYARSVAWRRRLGRLLPWVEIALLAALLVGVAGPYRVTTTERIDDAGIDVSLVLDISLSMLAEDFEPNRLAALRRIARDFLVRRSADRISLVIFAMDTFVQSPLTTDDAVLFELLEAVRTDAIDQHKSGGTAIGDALLVAGTQLEPARLEGRDQVAILITDGESNDGIDPVLAARHLRELGIELYAVGIGGDEPIEVRPGGRTIGDGLFTRLDSEMLERIAAAAGGRFFHAADTAGLEEIFTRMARMNSAPLEATTIETRRPAAPRIALLATALFGLYLTLSAGLLRRPLR